jgi:hypothetical protein
MRTFLTVTPVMMWRWYFGKDLHYIGIDINPEVKLTTTLTN